MKVVSRFLILFAAVFSIHDMAAGAPQGDLLETCISAIQGGGYRGGGMQVTCEGYFILPSPLLVRCIAGLNDDGKISDPQLRRLCQVHCETKGYYGPFMDYPADGKFLLGSALFKRLFDEKRCSEL